VSEIVVTRADDDSINTLEDLAGRTFYVRPSSSYWRSLSKLKDMGIDIDIKPAPENLETEEIIAKVAQGEYDLTVSDSHILDIELTWREDIKGTLALGDPVSHGWVVRSEDEKLLAAVNRFLKKEYRGLFYNITYQKYFQEPHRILKHVEDRVDRGEGGALSPFDDLVKAQADEHEFDWRLIVAQMYQESRFDPNAKSWAGARGLMQVMPRTARELGVENLKDPEQGIIAGVRYLSWLRDRFESELPVRDRMWFALAAYNAGAGHVRDARRLAKRQGWSSNRWFDNVEKAMLLLSKSKYANNAAHGYVRGSEPVRYVREIRDRYQAYLKLTNNGS
jgi:membrane-bound lytic murein transglycosylase F